MKFKLTNELTNKVREFQRIRGCDSEIIFIADLSTITKISKIMMQVEKYYEKLSSRTNRK